MRAPWWCVSAKKYQILPSLHTDCHQPGTHRGAGGGCDGGESRYGTLLITFYLRSPCKYRVWSSGTWKRDIIENVFCYQWKAKYIFDKECIDNATNVWPLYPLGSAVTMESQPELSSDLLKAETLNKRRFWTYWGIYVLFSLCLLFSVQ